MTLIQNNRYICLSPSKLKTMKNNLFCMIAVLAIASTSSSCKMLGGKNKSGGSLPNDGQLHGVAPASRWSLPKPPGMVYIPQGTFHMGPSDEDPAYAFSARNRSISISGFWMHCKANRGTWGILSRLFAHPVIGLTFADGHPKWAKSERNSRVLV